MTAKAYIKLGGTVNTAFLIFHLVNDWGHLHEPFVIILLTLLSTFSVASFLLTEHLLTRVYGKIIYWLFIALYALRAIRSIQTFIEKGTATDLESLLIFIGCVLCVGCYLIARRMYKIKKN